MMVLLKAFDLELMMIWKYYTRYEVVFFSIIFLLMN